MSERGQKPGDWDWERYAASSGGKRPDKGNRSGVPPFWMAATLIGLGVLLFLGNLGLLPLHDVWIFWPIFPLAAGIGQVIRPRNAAASVWGIFLIIVGVSFLLSNFGLVHIRLNDDRLVLPLLMILFGFLALMKILGGSQGKVQRPPFMPFVPPNLSEACKTRANIDYENSLHDFVLLGGLKRKLESPTFAGGELTSVFGSIEIDLRRAFISSPTNSVVLNTTALFGSIKVRVPQEWRVHVSGVSILGNFEDKTIPPNIGPSAAVLVITGVSIFSSVEIED
ncbi:MAG TPA: LiaF domain-containing protein [Bryobacteraceae bacterium]|nr:LiaF domain-containing protein [Bryobacteraceae bacterium]